MSDIPKRAGLAPGDGPESAVPAGSAATPADLAPKPDPEASSGAFSGAEPGGGDSVPDASSPGEATRPSIARFAWPVDLPENRPVPAYGAELAALIEAARAVTPLYRWGPVYDVVKAAFDYAFYLTQYPDIVAHRMDPVGHYLKAGARERRDPAPWFSTGEYRRQYLRDSPDTINPFHHYLTEGRAAGNAPRAPHGYEGFARTLGSTPVDTAERVRVRMADIRERLEHGPLGEMVGKAAAIDPLVANSWPAALAVRVPPASNASGTRRIAHLSHLQGLAEHRRARIVVIAGQASSGSPHDPVRLLVRALVETLSADEIVLVPVHPNHGYGDMAGTGLRVVALGDGMSPEAGYDRDRTLVEFVRTLRPEVVVNCDATLLWRALSIYGRALAASTRLLHVFDGGFLTCDSRAVRQDLAQFYRTCDLPGRMATVGAAMRDRFDRQFRLPRKLRDSIRVLHMPLLPEPQAADAPGIRIFAVTRATGSAPVVRAVAAAFPELAVVAHDMAPFGNAGMTLSVETPSDGNASWTGFARHAGFGPETRACLCLDPVEALHGPILDAIAAGTPLLAHFSPALRDELDGEGAVHHLEDPRDAGAVVAALRTALGPEPTRQDASRALRSRLAAGRSLAELSTELTALVMAEA